MKKLLTLVLSLIFISHGLYADSFKDIKEDYWARDYIEKLHSKKLINGYPDGTFKGENTITRAEFIKIISVLGTQSIKTEEDARLLLKDAFTKNEGHWAKAYYIWACKFGILLEDENYFKLKDIDLPITRGEIALLVSRALSAENKEKKAPKAGTTIRDFRTGEERIVEEISPFTDEDEFLDIKDSVDLARRLDIINGYPDKTFKANNKATRAEATKMLVKLIALNKIENYSIEQSLDYVGNIVKKEKESLTLNEENEKYKKDLSYINEGESWYKGGAPKSGDVKIENNKKLRYLEGYGWIEWSKITYGHSEVVEFKPSGILIGE